MSLIEFEGSGFSSFSVSEQMLPGCLESVTGAVDEVVVVDTGSVDGTRRGLGPGGAPPPRADIELPAHESSSEAAGRLVDPARAQRWREELTEADVKVIEGVLGGMLRWAAG